jgi:hypothetical protein
MLPAGLCEPPAKEQLRWILGHELTHLQRRDAWSGLLLGLGQALYFYVPFFWWLRRQVRLCQEYVADAVAVGQDVPPADYAEFLLSLIHAPAVPRAATGVSGHGSDLYRRITMLLQDPMRVEKHCPRLWSLGVAGGLLSLAVAAAGIGLRAESARGEEPPAQGEDKSVREKAIKVIVIGADGADKKDAEEKKPGQDARRSVILWQAQPGKPGMLIEKVMPAQAGFLVQGAGDAAKERITKKVEINLDAVRKALEKLEKVPGADVEQIRKEILKALEEVNKQAAKARPQAAEALKQYYQARVVAEKAQAEAQKRLAEARVRSLARNPSGRLGVQVESPSAALADQLNLPAKRGLVIVAVIAKSPAEKAGLKANDILLELDGKAVTSEGGDLAKMVEGIKANSPVDAIVLRKGKRETVKGLSLTEGQALRLRTEIKLVQPKLTQKALPALPEAKAGAWEGRAGEGAGATSTSTTVTTTFRSDNRFTTRYQEGSLIITVVGSGEQVSEINVQDGTVTHKYNRVDSVPARYRDKVNHLIEMSTRGTVRIERK